jgi:hypothetical protein
MAKTHTDTPTRSNSLRTVRQRATPALVAGARGTVFHVVAFGQGAGGETGGRHDGKGQIHVDSDGTQSVGQVEVAALIGTLQD